MRVVRGLLPSAVAVLVVAAAALGASSVPAQPLGVQAASLTQVGQDLVWQVELMHSFSPGALRRNHESLCLLIERAMNGSVIGQVCLAGPRPGSPSPSVLYSPISRVGPGPSVSIAATVTRSSDRELTASFLPSSIGLQYRPLRWQVLSTARAPGCTPAARGTSMCSTLFPATPAVVVLHIPRLVGCVPSGPDWVFTGPRKLREVALTFDDGPWDTPPTAEFVQELARLHAPATFFEIGEHIPEYDPHGTVEREMLADGDMIGDHTWSHPDMLGLSASSQRRATLARRRCDREGDGRVRAVPVPSTVRRRRSVAAQAGALDGVHDDPVGHRSARLGAAR